MATLDAFAIPLMVPVLGRMADHTYVVSSVGHVWPCNGRYAGGTLVCSGSGNGTVADCMSQTNSQAGIAYGKTGVCHQMANRILDPAQLIVSAANGYWVSQAVYGTYGLNSNGRYPGAVDFAARRLTCSSSGGGGSPGGPSPGGNTTVRAAGPVPANAKYVAAVRRLYELEAERTPPASTAAIPERAQHHRHLVQAETDLSLRWTLERRVKPALTNAFVERQLESRRQHWEAVERFEAGHISADEFAIVVNRNAATLQGELSHVLSPEDYRKHFGVEPGVTLALVNPDAIVQLTPQGQ